MKKKAIATIIVVIIILIGCIGICWHVNNTNNDFYLKYEYQDHWGGTIKQVIEINNTEYNYSLLINDHYELNDTTNNEKGTISNEYSEDLKVQLKKHKNKWKKNNRKITKYKSMTTDLPYEALIIEHNGKRVEIDYLPDSIKSILEKITNQGIYCVIEQSYNNSIKN